MGRVDWRKFIFPKDCSLTEQEKENLIGQVLRARYGYPTQQCLRARNCTCVNEVYDVNLKKMTEVLPFEECEERCQRCLKNNRTE